MNANQRPAMTESKVDETVYAVKQVNTGTMVGCYTQAKADSLRDEWNDLAFDARKERPYITVPLAALAACTPAKSEGR